MKDLAAPTGSRTWERWTFGLLAASLFFLLEGAGRTQADSSGYVRHEPREWKDAAGRVVKRVDASGRMVLLTWDEASRLIRVAGVAGRVPAGKPDGTVPAGGEAWVHCFLYGADGLAAEFDCRGERHEFTQPRAVDEKNGTALPGHAHSPAGRATGGVLRPRVSFEYDAPGRLIVAQQE